MLDNLNFKYEPKENNSFIISAGVMILLTITLKQFEYVI